MNFVYSSGGDGHPNMVSITGAKTKYVSRAIRGLMFDHFAELRWQALGNGLSGSSGLGTGKLRLYKYSSGFGLYMETTLYGPYAGRRLHILSIHLFLC